MEFLTSFIAETLQSAATTGAASLEFLKSKFFSSVLLPSLVSGGIIYLARRRGWHKSRVHYDISSERYLVNRKNSKDNKKLLQKLNKGKYEILSAKHNENGDEIKIVLSKIKKE